MIFKNLGEEKSLELFNNFVKEGMNLDDVWMEIYSIECNLDEKSLNGKLGAFYE